MWAALAPLMRYVITPRVARHRTFAWIQRGVVADSATIAIACPDDMMFGILHSRFHEIWSLRLGTSLGVGNDPRYTPTTTFETFPFPVGLTPEIPRVRYDKDPRAIAIATAAKRLNQVRDAWLNPSDLVRIEQEIAPGYPDRILPKDDASAAILRERTLTNLYNRRPQWLAGAHAELDAAVAEAYGWQADISDEEALSRLLALNLERPAAITSKAQKTKRQVATKTARHSPQFKLPIAGGRDKASGATVSQTDSTGKEQAIEKRRRRGVA